ncbi:hypothetical protein BH10ACI2_BH10ACI2_02520 [soil metagenome]
MIAIHRGKGFAVPIIGILSALAMNVLSTALFDNDYYAVHLWPKFGTFVLSLIV